MTVAALPFTIKRSDDAFGSEGIVSITETIHGLLRLSGDTLHVEWRLHRSTDRYGAETRTDREVEPVRQVAIPLAQLTGVEVRRPWWSLRGGTRMVITAASLEAFSALAGADGLTLPHPAHLELRLHRKDRAAGLHFAADLQMALGDRALRLASAGDDPLGGALPGHQ
ncbi:MAG: hypothetical protein KJZ47_14655 [Gemmatimonadales bacterium]|nr:hypothetical protein [Gemmatimonadales bacterium]